MPDRMEPLKYFRAEIHLREGGQDYDMMGLNKEKIIHDVVTQYDRHLPYFRPAGSTGREIALREQKILVWHQNY